MRVQRRLSQFCICPQQDGRLAHQQLFQFWGCKGIGLAIGFSILILLPACRPVARPTPRQITLQRTWELNPGDEIEGYQVAASLGDVTIALNGHALRAPFSGEVELAASGVRCIYFSTPEIPAYLFRFCGLRRLHLGQIDPGEVIGRGEYVHFATLRRQPDGSWTFVEPSRSVLERALTTR